MNWLVKNTKKVYTTLSFVKHFLILASTITGCVFISVFISLIGILIGITSSAIGLKIGLIIKKNKKKHDRTVLLAISKLNRIEGTSFWICNWFKY